MSKNLIALVIAQLISIAGFAQGHGINYKAAIKGNNGNLIVDQAVKIRFTIMDSGSNIVYQETHEPTTDVNGIVVLSIGWGDNSNGDFWDIDWANDFYLLGTEIDTLPFDFYVSMGEAPFESVPNAFHAIKAYSAETADNVTGLEKITQNGKAGLRIVNRVPEHYGEIGNYAVDLSYTDPSLFSVPYPLGAIGFGSIAMGTNTVASGTSSTAMGNTSIASGESATAIGGGEAIGNNSLAIGYSKAEGSSSTAIGVANATGEFSIAMGNGTEASGDYSASIGEYTTALGDNSTALGRNTIAYTFAETVIGSYNRLYNPQDTYSWIPQDRLFIIGNGENSSNRSDALTVLKNGNVITGGPLTIQRATEANSTWRLETRPNGSLSLYRNGDYRGFFSESTGNYSSISDRSTKRNIIALENGTLNKVMQLNPVSYLMKDQTDAKRNLGLISQEVQEVFPTLTTYVEESDLITLSYTELIPILIKALQEQQGIIENLKKDKSSLENTVNNLISRVEKIEVNNQ